MLRSLILVCTLLIGSLNLFAAKGKCGRSLNWELDQWGTLTITGSGDMDNYSFAEAPWRPSLVKNVELGEGIRTIGKNAFSKTKITSVTLPSSVEVIADGAFSGCEALAKVVLPYGLNTIGKEAFANCIALPSMIMPSSVRTIGEKAFINCRRLGTVSIPSRLTSLGKGAFKKCLSLTNIIELPDFITNYNCNIYGLSSRAVSYYYAEASSNSQNAIAAVTEQTEKTKNEPTKRIEGAAYGTSDVDAPLKGKPQNNTNTFAVVIANENYTNMADVPYANNDGNSFVNYCRYILGIPDDNISFYPNATSGVIKGAISYLRDIDEAYNGDINVIFYYAGHGSPSDATKEPFLIPVDAMIVNHEYCYAMDKLYSDLSGLKANSVKVFLDACFSGASRDNSMVEKARKVAIVPKMSELRGNLVVVSAATDAQTAWQYDSQGHGLFTYYLLKKLRDSNGEVSMGELTEYISDNVNKTSVVVNHKRQNPSVAASPSLGQKWRSWTVK